MNDLNDIIIRAAPFKKKDIARISGVAPKTVGGLLSKKHNPKLSTLTAIDAAIRQLEEQKNGKA